MHTRSRWSGPLSLLAAVAVTACSDTSTSPPLSFDEVPIAEEAETLKGEGKETGGACLDGWVIIDWPVGVKYDVNMNGFVCWDGVTAWMDDVLTAEGPETEFAGGQGTYIALGKKGAQNVTFAFHGRQNKTMVVKGQFELNDHANDLHVHGEVTCLIVAKNTAILGGIITQSTDGKLPVGAALFWRATDNGEGINEPVDFVTRPVLSKTPKEGCKGKFPIEPDMKIEAGNIQVLQ